MRDGHSRSEQGHPHRAAERRLVRPLRIYVELRSNAGLMITTEAMVAEAPKNVAAHNHGGDGGGMGGMDF